MSSLPPATSGQWLSLVVDTNALHLSEVRRVCMHAAAMVDSSLCALCRKGSGGLYTATEAIADTGVLAGTASLEATAAQLAAGPARLIASSIKLVGDCMRALPDILTGAGALHLPSSCLLHACAASGLHGA